MAQLTLEGLSKVFPGGVAAVTDATLEIADGEFVVLVGPSGCGKSTVLRMVAGLERASAGRVLIDGTDVTGMEPGDRDIAMVFQSYALYPHMSVFDNMAYGLRNQRMPAQEIRKRIEEAAEILQLGPLLSRRPRALSGGQRQRVAMGRAIVREPKAFLLDEPLSNLDAKLRAHMRAELKALHRRLNATFIYVTHDQVEAMSLADRIVLMNAGRIEQIGPPMALYSRPATRFVAEFIGAPPMNILAVDGPAGRQIAASLGTLPEGTRLIGVRPEALAPGGNALGARVTLSEVLGGETLLHLDAGGETLIAKTGPLDVTESAEMRFGVAREALAFFDADDRLIDA